MNRREFLLGAGAATVSAWLPSPVTLPLTDRRCHPLSGCAASPSLATREGDGTLAAGRRGRRRPLLGVRRWGAPVLSCVLL